MNTFRTLYRKVTLLRLCQLVSLGRELGPSGHHVQSARPREITELSLS